MDQRIIIDGHDYTDAVLDVAKEDYNDKILSGNLSQTDIAKLNHDNPPNMIEGLGEVKISINEDMFHMFRIKMKEELNDDNYECWQDLEFIEYAWKMFPSIRGTNNGRVVSDKDMVA
jgi:hypothetical protein